MTFDQYSIRLLTIDDLEDYFNLIARNRKRLEDFFAGTVAMTQTFEDTRTHLKDVVAKSETKEYFPFVVVDSNSNKSIASIQVKSVDWSVAKAELGYYVDQNYENKGIATKAVSLIIDHCFKDLKLAKLYIRTHKVNVPSIKIAESNGFKLEGIIRQDYKTTSGKLVDLLYYGLLNYERNVFHLKNEHKGAFLYKVDGKDLAKMVYSMPNKNLMIIEHTEVSESLKGQGIGLALQHNLVDYVRLNEIKVIPICPFAKKMFERIAEWRDVLNN